MFKYSLFNILFAVVYLLCLSINSTIQYSGTALKDNVPSGDLTEDDTLSLRSGHFIIRNRMTWLESKAACEKYCSSLAFFHDIFRAKKVAFMLEDQMKYVPEDYFTAENKYEFGLDRHYWVGLNDFEQEGKWAWTGTDEVLTYDFWYSETPHHYSNYQKNPREDPTLGFTEHCANLVHPKFREHSYVYFFTFHEEPCGNKHYAICNKPDKQSKDGQMCIPINTNISIY